jgi:hypothetical protein
MTNNKRTFWTSIPGILAALAGFITAMTGLYLALHKEPPILNGNGQEQTHEQEISQPEPDTRPPLITQNFHGQIQTTGQDAQVINEDGEVNTDDWTKIILESQTLTLSADGRTIYFDLVWSVHEGEQNKTTRPRTIIRSQKRFTFPFSVAISSIQSQMNISSKEYWYQGQHHSATFFPDHGLLSNIRVKFDGPGGNDQLLQELSADIKIDIQIKE